MKDARRMAGRMGAVVVAFSALAAQGAMAPVVLKPNEAVLLQNGKAGTPALLKDTFGPGSDGTVLLGGGRPRNELRYTCKDLPEGDYYTGLPVLVPAGTYFGIGEGLNWQLEFYHNDTRLMWTSHTEPVRPENAAEKTAYQAEVRVDGPLHLKPGDVLRVVAANLQGGYTVGPLRLYGEKPAGAVMTMGPGETGTRNTWLTVDWAAPVRTPDKITQACALYNPGVLPRALKLQVQARDYLMAPLMPDQAETLTIAPGQSVTKTYAFKPSLTGRDRLTLVAEAEGMWPAVRQAKFYMDDITQGPRPNTCLNGTDWEFCYAPGVEPGVAPPSTATWARITVPSLQSNNDHHIAWYRKTFFAPQVRGERVLLKFGQIFTEAWFYVNGKPVGHEVHGSTPFEVDISAGYKAGETNELLIAVRDWLAYSPTEQGRALRGEPLVSRGELIDVISYSALPSLGIDRSVWLEARPAVSVDDVFVVTSVREQKLKLKYRLINTTDQAQTVTVAPKVLDEGREINLLQPKPLTIPAGQSAELWFEAPWKDPVRWWPENPHLYALETAVRPTAGAADRHWQRFGFREMWIEGDAWVLNGARVKLKGAYGNSGNFADFFPGHCTMSVLWEPARRLEALWNSQIDQVENAGLELCRTFYEESLDVADETGLLAKRGGEISQPPFTMDKRFWEAALRHNLRWMNVSKNHPSVVYWEAANETMWMHIYLGEAARVFTSHWQLKIAKAMREFDLMRRPIDWDADGDLSGKWESSSLHYPRELSIYPAIPNSAWWGPRDGKTVAQDYMFGPVTLGRKPVAVGESFWVSPSLPYQPTILAGDRCYEGGNCQYQAWTDYGRYFINGYRDAEFAYIDTQPLLTPHDFPHFRDQVVVLKQESSSFYGGRTLARDVNVHNDIHLPARLTLRWSLTPGNASKAFSSGEKTLKMSPAELKRLTLNVKLPKVMEKTAAAWRLELWDETGGGTRSAASDRSERRPLPRLVHTECREWTLHPAPVIRQAADPGLAVYDPVGKTAMELEQTGVKFTTLADLTQVAGKALIVGRDAFRQPAQGAWREALAAFVRGGGKVVVFGQSEAPDFLPVTLQLAGGRRTIAFLRAGDHPILGGLGDPDLRWWAGSGVDEHVVADGNWQKPTRGRWLPLVDIGTGDGMTQSPLVELYDGKGSYVLCQMPVVEKALAAPPAGRMLQNMLDYLAAPGCFRTAGRTAVLAGADSPLRKALADSRLVSDDLTGRIGELKPDRYEVAIVDVATALDDGSAAALLAFAEGGGRVFLHRGTPEKQALLEKLLGARLRFFPLDQEPQDIQNHVIRMTDSGLLAGVSNHDLWWIGNAYLSMLRVEARFSSMYTGGCPPAERIADFFCWPADDAGDRVARFTRPGALLQAKTGKGDVVLSQLRLDEPIPETAVVVTRLRGLLLTNLGCELRGDGDVRQTRQNRLAQYQFTPIDLTPYATRGLTEDKAKGIIGWANQGENDMRELPTGRQTFAGIPFLIGAPKGVITLFSAQASNTELPKAVTGIKIGRKADALFFLHTMAWGAEKPFRYVAHYEDGTSVEIPIAMNQQVFGWWDNPDQQGLADLMARHGCFAAWKGSNPMVKGQGRWGIMLPGYEWANPHPDKVVKDLDFLTVSGSEEFVVPMLVAVTAATMQPDEGIVTDVINTRGVKVKLGTQEQDIYYIGLGGIEESHPFRAKAVAAHKAMVVGQKVKVVYDVVRKNSTGQAIAYVYAGDDALAGNLVNGKILAEGLSKLGDFEGNDRLRMYLINTGEPAKWRKVGMWTDGK